ncbi:hypothetical protein PRZ48_011280 [Zasmidium cellare]|uniref:Zn(2)-C6 fungal-type domain-containing protein n=1 Tax=Zasmidium cellare TaxID=395010 RepID=A0ABR0EBI2_ZASCE|nr:hypothetical protein PRZ48_011280 [Zasmidium cellare]
MQQTPKRTPRACERCRQTRRRCEPPYPCRQCVQSGVECDVREKARPHRRQQQQQRSRPASALSAQGREKAASTADGGTPRPRKSAAPKAAGRRAVQGDPYEAMRALVEDLLQSREGYALKCALVEPPSCRPGGIAGSAVSQPANAPPPLTLPQAWGLLKSFRKFMGFQDTKLVDIEELHGSVRNHLDSMQGLTPSNASAILSTRRLPSDSIGLVCAALALGAVASGEFGHGRFYFAISTELVKHFVGQPTLELCLAYYLQHVFALRSGTSNYAQGIMAQAVQIANGLGLYDNSYGVQGLQLYLLIYMADQ